MSIYQSNLSNTLTHSDFTSIVFLFGVTATDLLPNLSKKAKIYTDSLSNESYLKLHGFDAHYIYRDVDRIFDKAASFALDWLYKISNYEKLKASDFSSFFLNPKTSLWDLSYDALFEAKDGIFESIFFLCLIQNISSNQHLKPIYIYAPRENGLAKAALVLLKKNSFFNWTEDAYKIEKKKLNLKSFLEKVNKFLICPMLFKLFCFFEKKNKINNIAIVNSFGAMTHIYKDKSSKPILGDSYLENIIASIYEEYPNTLTIGLNAPHFKSNYFKKYYLEWKYIFNGRYKPWLGYAKMIDFYTLLINRKKYKEILEKLDNDQSFKDLFTINELCFYPIIQPKLFELVPQTFASSWLHFCISQRFIEKEKVDIVISTESFSNLGRCLASALHQKNGELWGIQGGIISPKIVTNIGFYAPLSEKKPHLMPDCFLVWGPEYKKILTDKFKIKNEKICVMGFNKEKKMKQVISFRKNKKILYITCANELVCPYLMTIEEESYTLKVIMDNLPRDVDLIIRIHPRARAALYSDIPKSEHVYFVKGSEISLEENLELCDCVIGKASTVLLEAVHAGKNVLMINLAGTPDFTGFSNSLVGLPCATDAISLRENLDYLINKSPDVDSYQYKKFSDGWCFGNSESATQKILEKLATRSCDD